MFSGVGGLRLGLEQAGWKCVGYCEIDKYARQTYQANFDTANEFSWEDATTMPTDRVPDHDCTVGGFPCQDFSVAGKREGFEGTRGTLFFEIARVLEAKKPRAFLLENVKGLLTEPMKPSYNKIISTLRSLGYSVSVEILNSRDFGVPQNRERVFFVGFKTTDFQPNEFQWPRPVGRKLVLSDVLEDNPDKKYDLSGRMVTTLMTHLARNRAKGNGWGTTFLDRTVEYSPLIPSSYYKGGGGAGRPVLFELQHGQTKGEPQEEAASIRSNVGGQQALLSFDLINMDQEHGVLRSPDEFQTVTSRNSGKGVAIAVTTTNPHDDEEERQYNLSEDQRTLSAASSGTNAPLVLQLKRYHASGEHEIREYADDVPTLTEQLGTGGHNVPMIFDFHGAGNDAKDLADRVRQTPLVPSLRENPGGTGIPNIMMVQLVHDLDDPTVSVKDEAFTLNSNPKSDRRQAVVHLRSTEDKTEDLADRVIEVEEIPALRSRAGGIGQHTGVPVVLDQPPLIVRVSSAESKIGHDRVKLVREDAPTLLSGSWASYANAVALNLKHSENATVSNETKAVTAAGSRSQLATLGGVRLRRLTPRECFRLQGFPDTFIIDKVSDHQAYRQSGNSVTVPVITAIGKAMQQYMKPNIVK